MRGPHRSVGLSLAASALAALAAGCPPGNSTPDTAGPPDALTLDAPDASDATTDLPSPDTTPSGDARACTDMPPGVQLTALNSVPAMGTGAAVQTWHVVYPSAGGVRVHGQLCVPQSPGPHPIIAFNHGGFAGIGANEWTARTGASANQCYNLAAAGFIVVMSQYRGESDDLGGALGTIQSEGRIEVCAGEVDDVAALIAIAQQRCDADPTRVAMWGASHGGCITLQALRRHLPGVRAGLALVPPVEFTAEYRYHVAHEPGGDAGADGCDPVAVHQALVTVITTAAGTPESNPAGYASRSVALGAADLTGVPFAVMYGVTDCLVPLAQACTLYDSLTRAGITTVNYHLGVDGNPVSAPVAGCPSIAPLAAGAWPGPAGLTGDRYFMVLDGQGHGFTGVGAARTLDVIIGFLGSHLR